MQLSSRGLTYNKSRKSVPLVTKQVVEKYREVSLASPPSELAIALQPTRKLKSRGLAYSLVSSEQLLVIS